MTLMVSSHGLYHGPVPHAQNQYPLEVQLQPYAFKVPANVRIYTYSVLDGSCLASQNHMDKNSLAICAGGPPQFVWHTVPSVGPGIFGTTSFGTGSSSGGSSGGSSMNGGRRSRMRGGDGSSMNESGSSFGGSSSGGSSYASTVPGGPFYGPGSVGSASSGGGRYSESYSAYVRPSVAQTWVTGMYFPKFIASFIDNPPIGGLGLYVCNGTAVNLDTRFGQQPNQISSISIEDLVGGVLQSNPGVRLELHVFMCLNFPNTWSYQQRSYIPALLSAYNQQVQIGGKRKANRSKASRSRKSRKTRRT